MTSLKVVFPFFSGHSKHRTATSAPLPTYCTHLHNCYLNRLVSASLFGNWHACMFHCSLCKLHLYYCSSHPYTTPYDWSQLNDNCISNWIHFGYTAIQLISTTENVAYKLIGQATLVLSSVILLAHNDLTVDRTTVYVLYYCKCMVLSGGH